MKTSTLLITLSLVLSFCLSLNAQHKLGLSYNPFVETYYSSPVISPLSGSLNYESKEFGRFSFRTNFYFENLHYTAENLFSRIYLNSENSSSSLNFSQPQLLDLDYISASNFGVGFDSKFRFTNSTSSHGLYIFGGLNLNLLYRNKWYYENDIAFSASLRYYNFLTTKFGFGYFYELNKHITIYAEPIANCRWSIGIWHFGVNTGVMFNLGK